MGWSLQVWTGVTGNGQESAGVGRSQWERRLLVGAGPDVDLWQAQLLSVCDRRVGRAAGARLCW